MARQVEFLAAGLLDENGDPYSAGTVNFYNVGLVTDKTIWDDINKAVEATNPVVLDSQGRAEVYAEGSYKVVVKDSDAVTIRTYDEMFFETGTEAPADGSITVAKLDAEVKGLLGGTKNQIRNGQQDLWSAGTSITGTTGPIAISDGWFYEEDADSGTAVDITISRNTVTIGGESISERVPKYSLNIANADNGSSLGVNSFHQVSARIYGVEKLQSESVVLSWEAKSDISKIVYVCAHQFFGTGGAPSASVYTTGGTTSGRSTFTTAYGTRLFQTINIPSVASKTLGSGGDDYLEIIISLQHGATRATTIGDVGGALVYDTSTGYTRLTNIQLEIGSTSTSFELRPRVLDFIRVTPAGKIIIGDPTGSDNLSIGDTSNDTTISISAGATKNSILSFDDTVAGRGMVDYDHNNDSMMLKTAAATRATINSSGDFLVAKTTADTGNTAGAEFEGTTPYRNFFTADGNTVLSLNRLTDDGILQNLLQAGSAEGAISVSGTTITYGTFTAIHWTQPGKGYFIPKDTPKGTILCTVDEVCTWKEGRYEVNGEIFKEDYFGDEETYKRKITKTKTVKNGKLEDIIQEYEIEVECKVFVVEKGNLPKSKISDKDKDPRAYAIYQRHDEDGDVHGVGLGAFWVRVDGPCKGGDLIVTSDNPGVGMVDNNATLRTVVAKITVGSKGKGENLCPCSAMCS